MTEQEASRALISLYLDYIKNPPKVRLELYDEYRAKRAQITEELRKSTLEKKQEEIKIK